MTQVEILDISLAGALLKLGSEPESMDAVVLKVTLSEDASFEMSGTLISRGDGNIALYKDLRKSENDYHLRRLLELNLGDAELMDRDIEALMAKLDWRE